MFRDVVLAVLLALCTVMFIFVFEIGEKQTDNTNTNLLICAVLDEMGADTTDPRIVEACPVP